MAEFLNHDQCCLGWTDWIPLNGAVEEIWTIPKWYGAYRVRLIRQYELTYSGKTGMGLRPRLRTVDKET